MNEFLSDIEKDKIVAFNEDAILVNAIRKVLLKSIYDNGVLRKDIAPDPLKNAALGLVFQTFGGTAIVSNEELGADLRALGQGINLLEQGLAQLAKIKRTKEGDPAPTQNPGV